MRIHSIPPSNLSDAVISHNAKPEASFPGIRHEITPEQLSIYKVMRDLGYSVDVIFYILEHGAIDLESALELTKTHFPACEESEGSAVILPMQSSCPICERDLARIEQICIPGCGHWFCKECVRKFIEVSIADNVVLKMPCLNHECDNNIPDSLIYELISFDLKPKYLKFKREAELNLNANLRWCPKPDCEGFDIGGTIKKTLTCNSCLTRYCYYCYEEVTDKHTECTGLLDYQLDQWSKENHIKHCPNCKRRVEKLIGCNHMTCLKCRYEWCWLCGNQYKLDHWLNCEHQKMQKKDVPWFIIGGLLFSPILWPFVVIIFVMVYMNDYIIPNTLDDSVGRFLRKKMISLTVAFFVSIIITPPALVFGLLFTGIGVLIEIGDHLETPDNTLQKFTSKTWFWVPFSIIVGICISPFVVVSAVIGLGITHLTGIVLVFYKLHVYIRRFFDPTYLNITVSYGNY